MRAAPLLACALLSACAGGGARPRPANEWAESIGTDVRVELWSALALLGEAPQPGWRPGERAPEVEAARRRLAPFASHPAAAQGRRERDELALVLAASEAALLGEAPLPPDADPRLAGAREFAAKARFRERFAETEGYRARIVAAARAETANEVPRAALESYLRAPVPRLRVILAPHMPRRLYFAWRDPRSGEELLLRSPDWKEGKPIFAFDYPASSLSHEAVHRAIDALAAPHKEALRPYAGRTAENCLEDDPGCVTEHAALAVSLRVLRREKGEEEYRRRLAWYEDRGFAHLKAVCERLAEWEASPPERTFSAFYPRLVDVFHERLGAGR